MTYFLPPVFMLRGFIYATQRRTYYHKIGLLKPETLLDSRGLSSEEVLGNEFFHPAQPIIRNILKRIQPIFLYHAERNEDHNNSPVHTDPRE